MLTENEQKVLAILKDSLHHNWMDIELDLLEKRDKFARSIRYYGRQELLDLLPTAMTQGRRAEQSLSGMDDAALRKKLIGLRCEELGLEKVTKHVASLSLVIAELEKLEKEK